MANTDPDFDGKSDSRISLYQLLAAAYRYPDAEALDEFHSGRWGKRVASHLNALGIDYDHPAPRLAQSSEDYEVEFLGLFEVGMGGAPCPLHSGYYSRDRMRDMEEVVRFYRFFGYQPQRTSDRFPDHLVFELTFMAHLIGKARVEPHDVESVLLAQRDFCTRHLANWLPGLRESVEQRATVPFIKHVVRITDELVASDCRNLEEIVGGELRIA